MNVLLVRPPSPYQNAELLSHTQPLNLAYLAAWLRQKGHNVILADYETEPYSPELFNLLIADYHPEMVGVSCMTPTIRSGAMLCKQVKKCSSEIMTVVGGSHSNALPLETLREFPEFDVLVYGEGEETLGELCDAITNAVDFENVRGLAFRKGDKLVLNPSRPLLDLDSLPLPARDLLSDMNQPGHFVRGFSNSVRSTELYTSRGCPFGCSFCAIQSVFGRQYRFRSLESIAEEIGVLAREYRINHLVIADDTFTLEPGRAEGICKILTDSGIGAWNCDTRVSSVTPYLLKVMKQSGCQKVAFGVESGSQRIMDLVGKKITVEQVKNAVIWAKEAGIKHVEGNFIIGADPSETAADFEMTRQMIAGLPWTFISVAIIVPYPGTPVYEKMKAAGQIDKGADWDDFVMFGALPSWHTDHFSATQLLQMQKQLTRQFYLRPSYIARQLCGIRSWRDLKYWVSAGSSYLTWYFTGKI